MVTSAVSRSQDQSARTPVLTRRSGRWLDGFDPESTEFWNTQGRPIARRNLGWSIYAEFLGFIIWQLWSVVVVLLPAAGFAFTSAETFWLLSVPSLVGATLRFPYTFMVPRFGGRNWTIVSALLLLIPASLLAIAVGNPDTPFWLMLVIAALAGFGGGNFASSMANITYFFPQREKGWALGLNAAGGNLGTSVAQFFVPVVVSVGAGIGLGLPLAGWMWVPFILVAAWGAWRYMDNLSSAKADLAGSAAALREPHLWLLSLLYIGTFGSFIGFSSVFPKLIVDEFPEFSALHIGAAVVSLAFLGALVGSLFRPLGGRLADRFGGARVTVAAFAVMAVGAFGILGVLALGQFWLFLVCFLVLFAATGVGNGSTYRMIPIVFSASAVARREGDAAAVARRAAAALGLISGIGAYGGFVVPQVLNASQSASGGYEAAFVGFGIAYIVLLLVTVVFYAVPRASLDGRRI
ncbi:MFS transporter [Microbacterium sp. AK031]|uniref:MFS transporter n=1 Tax=Microbacterium sp. AK031 TaxID=2723076 RepID=UPI002166FA6B|nr:nitrate/nitrite transporter [Microbacterium sp. AK031]MCS3842532.1 NNP family nitrate/nitrite transporter-like MFS transporter [Microbacterium sp. AK031]